MLLAASKPLCGGRPAVGNRRKRVQGKEASATPHIDASGLTGRQPGPSKIWNRILGWFTR